MTREADTMTTDRHFLQIPGPTNVPDRVLRAMMRRVIPPFLLVDAVSALGSIEFRFDNGVRVRLGDGVAVAQEFLMGHHVTPHDRAAR